MGVLGKGLPESGEFGIEWWKGNLEAVCVQIRRGEMEIRASGKENGECAAKDEREQGKGEACQGPRRQ